MKRDWSLIAIVGTMIVWGINFSFMKHVLEHISAGAFLFLRFSTMTLLGFLLVAAIFRGSTPGRPDRVDLPRFFVCGLLGHAFHFTIVTYGIGLSTAFSSSLVLTSGPLFTLLIIALVKSERLRMRQVIGSIVAFAGIILFLLDKLLSGMSRAVGGDLLLLLGAMSFSLYVVLSRPLAERYGALAALLYSLWFATPVMLVATLPSILDTSLTTLPPSVWIGLFWSLVLSGFCGLWIFSWVTTVRGVARTVPFQYLQPPIAGVVAWLSLGESFTVLKVIGAGTTMLGVAYAQFSEPSGVKRSSSVEIP